METGKQVNNGKLNGHGSEESCGSRIGKILQWTMDEKWQRKNKWILQRKEMAMEMPEYKWMSSPILSWANDTFRKFTTAYNWVNYSISGSGF